MSSRGWFVTLTALAAGTALACGEDLIQNVPTEVCASGKRWIGDLTPNERMFPGHDCVGCHQDNDGPEFMAAGTIYGIVDADGSRTILHDCFGVEGVSVTITAADGQVLQTRTNEAGNFYFEGRQAALKKPFRVMLEYTSSAGVSSREFMDTAPSYGGCAHCHSQDATSTNAIPGTVLGPDEVVGHEYVFPIYTGPVSE